MGNRNMEWNKYFHNFLTTMILNVVFVKVFKYVSSHKTMQLMIWLSFLISVKKQRFLKFISLFKQYLVQAINAYLSRLENQRESLK